MKRVCSMRKYGKVVGGARGERGGNLESSLQIGKGKSKSKHRRVQHLFIGDTASYRTIESATKHELRPKSGCESPVDYLNTIII